VLRVFVLEFSFMAKFHEMNGLENFALHVTCKEAKIWKKRIALVTFIHMHKFGYIAKQNIC
jgi:hypothetical protein